MLHEVARVNQKEPHVRRRWFRDDYFDIFTWQAANGDVVGFQLCYDLTSYERVLSWRAAKGYSHHRVDGGEASPIKNRTPIMVADGFLPLDTVLEEFDQRAVELDAMLRTFLRKHLVQYGNAKPGEIDNLQTGV